MVKAVVPGLNVSVPLLTMLPPDEKPVLFVPSPICKLAVVAMVVPAPKELPPAPVLERIRLAPLLMVKLVDAPLMLPIPLKV